MRTIKHKLATRPSWSRVVEKEYHCAYINREDFQGYVTQLKVIKAKRPLYVYMRGKRLKVLDNNYSWYMFFPNKEHYSLTMMCDQDDQPVQCYFDLVCQNELDEDGVPGFDDLFLDVVVTKDSCILLDEEDLSAALLGGVIDGDIADTVYYRAQRILKECDGHFDELVHWAFDLVNEMKTASQS